MSKIQIESNSQRKKAWDVVMWRCIYHVKDTNRKQFTTHNPMDTSPFKLYLSCQRYKSKAIHNGHQTQDLDVSAVFIMSKIQIESNSQLVLALYSKGKCCIYHVKDTNRKQFTTWQPFHRCFWSCIYHVKDTNRKQFTTGFAFIPVLIRLYLSCQRYKSKAIHNWLQPVDNWFVAVFIMSKIQIESNSQL